MASRLGMLELLQLVRAIDSYDGDETPKRRAITRAALMFTMLTWAQDQRDPLATWDEFEGSTRRNRCGACPRTA